jgi:hypothetical protein
MNDNPYRSPQQAEPANIHPIAPVWRRLISLPLMIFGVLGFFIVDEYFIVALRESTSRWEVYHSYLFFLIPAGMVTAGILFRRRPQG